MCLQEIRDTSRRLLPGGTVESDAWHTVAAMSVKWQSGRMQSPYPASRHRVQAGTLPSHLIEQSVLKDAINEMDRSHTESLRFLHLAHASTLRRTLVLCIVKALCRVCAARSHDERRVTIAGAFAVVNAGGLELLMTRQDDERRVTIAGTCAVANADGLEVDDTRPHRA